MTYLLHGIKLLVFNINMIKFYNQEEAPAETPETPVETPETPVETPADEEKAE